MDLSDEEKNLRLMAGLSNYARWQLDSISGFVSGDVLEIGGGVGAISTRLLALDAVKSLTVTEVDPKNLEVLKKKLGGDADVCDINLEKSLPKKFEKKFDAVIAINVMEHVLDDRTFFTNCCECLRKGGRLVIQVPAMRFLFGEVDRADSHYRRYEKSDLRALSKENGLVVKCLQYMNLPGAAGWFYQGKILKLRIHKEGDLSLFDKLVPLFRKAEGIMSPPFGLSLIFCGLKV